MMTVDVGRQGADGRRRHDERGDVGYVERRRMSDGRLAGRTSRVEARTGRDAGEVDRRVGERPALPRIELPAGPFVLRLRLLLSADI